MSEWQCQVCNYEGHPAKLRKVKEEWGHDYYCECPSCETTYCNDCIENRAEGEICAYCGEFVEEVVELNMGGSKPDMVCRECEEEANG